MALVVNPNSHLSISPIFLLQSSLLLRCYLYLESICCSIWCPIACAVHFCRLESKKIRLSLSLLFYPPTIVQLMTDRIIHILRYSSSSLKLSLKGCMAANVFCSVNRIHSFDISKNRVSVDLFMSLLTPPLSAWLKLAVCN